MKTYALRLHPREDLKSVLDSFAEKHKLEAACVVTCLGRLQKAALRFANQEKFGLM